MTAITCDRQCFPGTSFLHPGGCCCQATDPELPQKVRQEQANTNSNPSLSQSTEYKPIAKDLYFFFQQILNLFLGQQFLVKDFEARCLVTLINIYIIEVINFILYNVPDLIDAPVKLEDILHLQSRMILYGFQ